MQDSPTKKSSFDDDRKEQNKQTLVKKLQSHPNPIGAFLNKLGSQKPAELSIKIQAGTLKDVSIDEIIQAAMKDPVNGDGTGDNLSARILREEFDIDVSLGPDQQIKNSLKPHHHAYKDALKKAWLKKSEDEASFVEEFFKHHGKKRSHSWWCTFTFWKGAAREQATPLSIVNHSRRHWFFRIIPFFTFSGDNSYQVLKDKFGEDTRNSIMTSKQIAAKLVESIRAQKK